MQSNEVEYGKNFDTLGVQNIQSMFRNTSLTYTNRLSLSNPYLTLFVLWWGCYHCWIHQRRKFKMFPLILGVANSGSGLKGLNAYFPQEVNRYYIKYISEKSIYINVSIFINMKDNLKSESNELNMVVSEDQILVRKGGVRPVIFHTRILRVPLNFICISKMHQAVCSSRIFIMCATM